MIHNFESLINKVKVNQQAYLTTKCHQEKNLTEKLTLKFRVIRLSIK